MGLLDDAIREHLELKRKHGAAEDELRRQESEALGPARRDFAAADDAVAPSGTEPAAEFEAAPEPGTWLDDEPAAEPLAPEVAAADPRPSAEPLAPEVAAADPRPPAEPLAPEVAAGDPRAPSAEPVDPGIGPAEPLEHAAEAVDPALGQEPLPAPDPAPPRYAEPEDEPFGEPRPAREETPAEGFPALDADDEPPGEPGEDVLEETPEFLQDTPEHDRLWFEQKPPRDFDFDD